MSVTEEPLGLALQSAPPPPGYDDLRARRFVFSSRGDRVPGRLLLPPRGDGPFPAVLVGHGSGGAKDAAYLDATGGPWARRGLAVASIDFPLHGERAESKLGAILASELARLRDANEVPASLTLAGEFARQTRADLARALSALEALPEIDAARIGYAGFSLGAILGAIFCAHDERPRAIALALGGGGVGPEELDPACHVAKIAPRPLLLVNATNDETITRSQADALFRAAAEPKQQQWFEGTHSTLPGVALKAMWSFLDGHLAVTGAATVGG